MEFSTGRRSAIADDFRTSASESIVASKMLVLRSKLLMLACAQRFFEQTRDEDDLKRIERLRTELHNAEMSFAAIEARSKSAERSSYRSWIYRSLIEVARTTLAKVRERHRKQTAAEKFELATDLQMLEELVERWSNAMREESHSA
jgi:hypothetical protein